MLSSFEYAAPDSIDELHRLLDEHGDSAEILAGGTDLLVDIRNDNISPDNLINIKNIDRLAGIDFDSDQGLRIGALVTCGELIADPAVSDKFPYLTEAAL
ncbi:MAG: FAD binding domain-containing protein, partial [bacterium]